MKTLASDTLLAIADGTGLEPLLVIEIEWDSGTKLYSEKDLSFYASDDTLGKILNTGSVTSQLRAETSGDLTTIQVQLDDTDGDIKLNVNTDQIIGTKAKVWYCFDNGDTTHTTPVLLMSGHIASDVSWDEGNRQITLTIDTAANNKDSVIGYAPTVDDFPDLNTEVSGKMWPICFGSVLKVPCVQVYKAKRGTLSTYLNNSTTTINIQNGEAFPQGTSIQIQVGYVVCTGSFNGSLFTLTSRNDAYYTNIATSGTRSGPDGSNPSVLWITDATKNMVGQYCYIAGSPMINYCNRQEGTKCYFIKPWKQNGQHSPVLVGAGFITETSLVNRSAWGDTFIMEHYAGGIWTTDWSNVLDSDIQYPGFGVLEFGIPDPTYVCNSVSTSSIKGVYAYRTIDGVKQLVQIPSSRYVKTLNTTLNGQLCSTITLYQELDQYIGENWETEIFVTLVSAEGPNTADVIQYLLETYTPYTADATSFAAVNTLLTRYPSHFALFEQRDVIDLLADIAFQARCALVYDGDSIKISYLSKLPTIVNTIDTSNINMKSVNLGYTNREDIITDFTLTWRKDYIEEEQEYRYKNNIDSYGQNKQTYDFFIYNIESLVALSAAFWGVRKSNCWRTNKCKTFLNALAYESFDCVGIKIEELDGDTYLRSELIGISFDTTDSIIDLESILAVKSGSLIEDTTFYTGYPAITGSEATPADPTDGVAEVDYAIVVPVPNNPVTANTTVANLRFTGAALTKFVRGVAQTVTASIVDGNGNTLPITGSFTLTLAEITAGDTLSTSTVSFTNGEASFSLSMTGGSTDTTGVLNITGSGYGAAISASFTITSHATPTITITPTVINRDSAFTVSITGADPSATYSVSLTFDDVDEELHDTSGLVTSLTTNGSGAFTASDWKFKNGTLAVDTGFITISIAGNDYDSETLTVLEFASDSKRLFTSVNQVAHGFAELTAIQLSSGIWQKSRTGTTVDQNRVEGIVTKVIDVDNFEVTHWGIADVTTSTVTFGQFVLSTTAGVCTNSTVAGGVPPIKTIYDRIVYTFKTITTTKIFVDIHTEIRPIHEPSQNATVYTSSATPVAMVPGLLYIFTVVGGGGGGAGGANAAETSGGASGFRGGNGGGSGAVNTEYILATEDMTYEVTGVGSGGTAGAIATSGGTGGTTTLVIKKNGTTILTITAAGGTPGVHGGDPGAPPSTEGQGGSHGQYGQLGLGAFGRGGPGGQAIGFSYGHGGRGGDYNTIGTAGAAGIVRVRA